MVAFVIGLNLSESVTLFNDRNKALILRVRSCRSNLFGFCGSYNVTRNGIKNCLGFYNRFGVGDIELLLLDYTEHRITDDLGESAGYIVISIVRTVYL